MADDVRCKNPIRTGLDASGIPWRLPRTELAARYDIRRHAAYGWEVIEVDTKPPIIEGLLWPLSAQVTPQFAPHLPATQFTALVRVADDALENFRWAVKHFMPALGPAATHSSANSIDICWSYEAARLSLVVWPPAMQRWTFTNPAQDRDPRLKTACLLSVDTGFRPAATPAERGWLATFESVAPIETQQISDATARHTPAAQGELEYVREPPAEATPLFGSVGLSADRMALIFYGAQLYVVAVEDVVAFHVARMLPAKGLGGSRLDVECLTRCPDLASKRLTITRSQGPEDLNSLAAELSRKTARPFELGQYEHDA